MYGFYACEVDAFGKAEISVLLDQASRDDIGNLLCCSCAFFKHSDTMQDLQCADASFPLPDRRACSFKWWIFFTFATYLSCFCCRSGPGVLTAILDGSGEIASSIGLVYGLGP